MFRRDDRIRPRPWGLLALAALCAGCSESPGPRHEGGIQWLSECYSSADCAAPYTCHCGVCTIGCIESGDCVATDPTAACFSVTEPSCQSAEPTESGGYCLEGCQSNEDCRKWGPQVACVDGVCIAPSEIPFPDLDMADDVADDFDMPGEADPDVNAEEPLTNDADVEFDTDGSCGDFTVTVIDWSWQSFERPDVYTIATLLQVDGPHECYFFPDFHEHNWLEFSWEEGDSLVIYRNSADLEYHAGFGPRSCSDEVCEIGDVFQTDSVYPEFPDNDRMQGLVDLYGLPDQACGHVFNGDLIEHVYCAPLSPP